MASAYAARLMGDAGADVVKVEPPAGDAARRRGPFPGGVPDPERSGMFLALNLNKRGITLDPSTDRDGLDRLLAWADVLVHDLRASAAGALGLDAQALRAAFPELVTLAITPFGQRGPYAEYAAEELTVANAGGWANLCPATSTDPSLPPLKVFGDQCALMSGIVGAMTALAAARETRRSGVGEYIDLSEQAYVASVLEGGLPILVYRGGVTARHNQRMLIPWRIFDAKDGPVFLVCVEQDQWERLVEFMGHPDWADLPTFAQQAGRAENADLVHMFLAEFVGEWRARELYHQAQARRICVAPVMALRSSPRTSICAHAAFSSRSAREKSPWSTSRRPRLPPAGAPRSCGVRRGSASTTARSTCRNDPRNRSVATHACRWPASVCST